MRKLQRKDGTPEEDLVGFHQGIYAGWPVFLGKQNQDFSRTFKHLNNLSPTYSTTVFSIWHSFYGMKSANDTDVCYISYRSPMTGSFFT